jgi:hypothetical protein
MRRRCGGFGQQGYRSDEEAECTKCREGVGRGQVDHASCRGDDIGGNSRDPEGDASGKVDGGDPPLEAAARSARQTTADLDVCEIARDEEARRSNGIGSPDQPVVRRLLEPRLHRPEGVDVEQQRANELEHTAPPIDPSRLEGEQAKPLPLTAAARSTVGIEGFEALERCRRGEEDRADEEHHPVDARPDESTNPRNGAIRKQLDPTAKRTPIHHDARSGAHHTRSWPGATRESRDACLRCARDDHTVVLPSGRRKVRWVVNGPTAGRATGVHPSGASGYELMTGARRCKPPQDGDRARTGVARPGPPG